MVFNESKLQEEIQAAGLPGDAGYGYIIWHVAPTQQQIDLAAQVIANHNPNALTAKQKGREALRDMLDNNADLLKYGHYFITRAKLLTAQQTPPRDTNLATLTTATVALMQGDRATDTDHNAMWRLFLWKLRMKWNIFNTEDELPPPPLTAAQARNVLVEADSFIEWGRTTIQALLLRHLF